MQRVKLRTVRRYEGQKLLRLLRHSKDPIAVRRAEIVLASAQGEEAGTIAERLYFSADYVRKVIHRFNEEGLDSLRAQYANGGRPKQVLPEHESQLLELAMTPPNLTGQPFTHWSLQKLRDVAVQRRLIPTVTVQTVQRVLQKHHFSLQRTKTWKQSKDPDFVVKKTVSKPSTGRRKRDAGK